MKMNRFCLSTFLIVLGCSGLMIITKAETIIVSSILSPPYLVSSEPNASKPVLQSHFSGFIKDVLDGVATKISAEFRIKLVKDQKYGSRNADGTFTGMIGDVIRKDADIAAGALTVTSTRRQAVDFSPTIQNFGHVVVMRKPRSVGHQPSFHERISHLYNPLADSVWLMSLVAYLVTSTVLFLISYVNPYEWRRLARDGEATSREGETFDCINSFWFIVSSWALQGFGARTPRSVGGRTVVLFWWIFVILFVSTYIASLTNILRANPLTKSGPGAFGPIHDLEDLSDQTEVQYGMLTGGATEQYFKAAQLPYMRNIWSYVDKNTDLSMKSTHQGIEKVRNPKPFAFIMESAMAKYYTKRPPCDLYYAGDLTMTGNYAFAYRHGFKYAKQLDMAILQLRENGVLQALEEKWFGGKCGNYFVDAKMKENYLQSESAIIVDLGSFSGALILLVLGVVAGCLITGIEIFIFKKAETPAGRNRGGNESEANDVSQPVLPSGDRGVTKL